LLEESFADSDSHTERASDVNDDSEDFGAFTSDDDEKTEDEPEFKTQPVDKDVSGRSASGYGGASGDDSDSEDFGGSSADEEAETADENEGKTQSDVEDVSGSSGSADDFYDRDDKHYPLRGLRRLVVANKMQYIFYWADDTKSYHSLKEGNLDLSRALRLRVGNIQP